MESDALFFRVMVGVLARTISIDAGIRGIDCALATPLFDPPGMDAAVPMLKSSPTKGLLLSALGTTALGAIGISRRDICGFAARLSLVACS